MLSAKTDQHEFGADVPLLPILQATVPYEDANNAYIHLHHTVHGERKTTASLVWSIVTLTGATALSIFGAWVFITPAMKAVTDSERVRHLLSGCSESFIQGLGKLAGVESFLSNCGVNFDCINDARQEWSDSLEALDNLQHENLDQWYDYVLEYASTVFVYLWTLASVIPYYMLSLNDDFVKTADTLVKHLYSSVITLSLYFVNLRGISIIQKDLENSKLLNNLLSSDSKKTSTKVFRQAQSAYFKAMLNNVETAGEQLFILTSRLIEMALEEDNDTLAERADQLMKDYPFLAHKHYQTLHTTIKTIGTCKSKAESQQLKLQLYFDIMYHLEQIVADKDLLLDPDSDFNANLPSVAELKGQQKLLPDESHWSTTLLNSMKELGKVLAKVLFLYYAANYIFSVIGYGLDAGYAIADQVSDEWKAFVFNLVNGSTFLAFFGLCLPSLNDGWDILCDLFVNTPLYLIHSALHWINSDYFSSPSQEGYESLEKQFNRIVYASVCVVTVLACIFSGGTNARVNEVNLPRFLNELNFSQLWIDILDFHAWIFAWISSAIMNSWFTMNVTMSALSNIYQHMEEHQETLNRKQNLYQVADELGTYSVSSTKYISTFFRNEYEDQLVSSGHITKHDIDGLRDFVVPGVA